MPPTEPFAINQTIARQLCADGQYLRVVQALNQPAIEKDCGMRVAYARSLLHCRRPLDAYHEAQLLLAQPEATPAERCSAIIVTAICHYQTNSDSALPDITLVEPYFFQQATQEEVCEQIQWHDDTVIAITMAFTAAVGIQRAWQWLYKIQAMAGEQPIAAIRFLEWHLAHHLEYTAVEHGLDLLHEHTIVPEVVYYLTEAAFRCQRIARIEKRVTAVMNSLQSDDYRDSWLYFAAARILSAHGEQERALALYKLVAEASDCPGGQEAYAEALFHANYSLAGQAVVYRQCHAGTLSHSMARIYTLARYADTHTRQDAEWIPSQHLAE